MPNHRLCYIKRSKAGVPTHRPHQERRQRLSAPVEAEETLEATSPSATSLFRPIMNNNRKYEENIFKNERKKNTKNKNKNKQKQKMRTKKKATCFKKMTPTKALIWQLRPPWSPCKGKTTSFDFIWTRLTYLLPAPLPRWLLNVLLEILRRIRTVESLQLNNKHIYHWLRWFFTILFFLLFQWFNISLA